MGLANKKISLIYHQKYDIPLPPNHRFMSSKFSDLFEEIKRNHLMDQAILLKPKPVAEMDLVIAHDPIYIKKIIVLVKVQWIFLLSLFILNQN